MLTKITWNGTTFLSPPMLAKITWNGTAWSGGMRGATRRFKDQKRRTYMHDTHACAHTYGHGKSPFRERIHLCMCMYNLYIYECACAGMCVCTHRYIHMYPTYTNYIHMCMHAHTQSTCVWWKRARERMAPLHLVF